MKEEIIAALGTVVIVVVVVALIFRVPKLKTLVTGLA